MLTALCLFQIPERFIWRLSNNRQSCRKCVYSQFMLWMFLALWYILYTQLPTFIYTSLSQYFLISLKELLSLLIWLAIAVVDLIPCLLRSLPWPWPLNLCPLFSAPYFDLLGVIRVHSSATQTLRMGNRKRVDYPSCLWWLWFKHLPCSRKVYIFLICSKH